MTNIVGMVFLAGILAVMDVTPDLRLAVYLIPVWLAVLGIGYKLRTKTV